MQIMTGWQEFLTLALVLPFLFSPFLILVSVLIRAFVWRWHF